MSTSSSTIKPATPAYAAWITAYLAVTAAAQLGWLHWAGAAPPPAADALLAAPVLLAGALALCGRADEHGYRPRLLACGALAPPLLLLWGQTQPVALPPVVTALHALLLMACHAAALSALMHRLALRWPQRTAPTALARRLPRLSSAA